MMNNKTRKKSNEQDAEKVKAAKRMRTESNSMNSKAGPSSHSTNSQKKKTEAENKEKSEFSSC